MKRVFLSYSADSEEHRARVIALAQQLRREGVDAVMDALARPAPGWAAEAIEGADHVLAICSERYRRMFEGRVRPTDDASEAERVARLAERHPGRVVPVLLEDGASHYVPLALRAVAAYYLPEQQPRLLRLLGATGEPAPPLRPRSESMEAVVLPADTPPRRLERRISNVSPVADDDFVGRTFELSAIRTALTSARAGGSDPAIVIGAAGIGKTALALQYAQRQEDSYDVVWVVRAQTESTIRLDLALLARELGLIAPGVIDDDTEVMAARSWLATHERWLLIFDEAAGIDVVGPYVPRPAKGHVLVTSRGSDWRDAGKKVMLSSLAREDSISLLLRASGRSDPAGADELASWLEGHPLMAKLAGALARARGVALDALHRQLIADAGVRPSRRLEAILALAVEDARQRSPATLALVELIANLAPHEIPIRLLREHVEHLAPELAAVARDDGALAALLDDLVSLGMVTRDDSSFSVHAAVQSAMRASARSGAAVVLLDAAFGWDSEHPETWAAAEELLPHVLVAIEDRHAAAAQPRALRRLLVRTAACTWKRGEPARAIDHQRRAVALLETAGSDAAGGAGSAPGGATNAPDLRTQLAGALASLGHMLREVGELAEAAVTLERARALLAKSDRAAETVPVLRELARVAAARGDFAGAREQLEQALAVDRERLGVEEHLSIAATLLDLSGVEVEADRIDVAARLLEDALGMQRRLLATDEHPQLAATLRRSAAIHARRGDLPGARRRLELAVEMLRRVLKTDHHVAILDALGDLANILMRAGDLVGAQRILEQTLESQARLFGGASPNGATVAYSLARVLILQGDPVGARRQLDRALGELHACGLPSHPIAAAIFEQLAELDIATDLERARVSFEQALVIRQELPGPEGELAVSTAASLAKVMAMLGQVDEAFAMLEPLAAQFFDGTTGLPAAAAVDAQLAIAEALDAVGRTYQARTLLLAALQTLEGGSVPDEVKLARGKLMLARILLRQEDLLEARQTAREAYELSVAAFGRTSSVAGTAALLRAEIALAGDEPAKAFQLAARALRACDERGGDAARATAARALELAGRAAFELGRRATAAALFQRALEQRDTQELRSLLFALVERLAAEGSRFDAAPAVALLQRLAPSWLADRVFAKAALESAQITNRLEVALTLAGAATAAMLRGKVRVQTEGGTLHTHTAASSPRLFGALTEAPELPPPSEYRWRLELAPIRAEGVAAEVRSLAPEAQYLGQGRLLLTASTAELPWGTYLLTVRFVDSPRDVWRADVPISNVELGNPFLAGPPVKGERFFGRARLLEDLLHHLADASIALLGPRRSGKTSVLYRIAQLCAEGWTVVTVDLHGYSGVDDRVFLLELAGQIARAAGLEAPPEDRPFPALRRALGAAGVSRVLLLLDEMAILERYPDAALQLRAMSKWESPQVRIVMAGTSRDLDRLTSAAVRGSSPVNEFLNRELDQLTRQEAVQLLEQPVLGRYRYEPAAIERLLELGAGRPFFLNALAHLTLEVVRQEGARLITAEHVEAARQEAQSYLARWYRELVNELDEPSRAALPALVEAGGPVDGRHAEALRSAGITVGPRRAMVLDPIFVEWWRRGGSR